MAQDPKILAADISSIIRTIRGLKVILDSDLAAVYGVPTFRFNEAVRRNLEKFPSDFLFQLSKEEFQVLTSQTAISKTGRGGRRSLPWAFTEYGALQAANILNSPQASAMSVYVIRAFIRMRDELAASAALEKRLAVIEKTLICHDTALRDVIQKMRPLLMPPNDPPKRKIGFHAEDEASKSIRPGGTTSVSSVPRSAAASVHSSQKKPAKIPSASV
jgi:hypothetical protein